MYAGLLANASLIETYGKKNSNYPKQNAIHCNKRQQIYTVCFESSIPVVCSSKGDVKPKQGDVFPSMLRAGCLIDTCSAKVQAVRQYIAKDKGFLLMKSISLWAFVFPLTR